MANPQKENGHTDIAHELMEQFARIQLSPYEWQVLFVILRRTYGWHKKKDTISLSQFQLATGIPSSNISRTLNRLAQRNIITKSRNGYISEYALQKDYTLWQSSITTGSIPVDSISTDSISTDRKVVSAQIVKPVSAQIVTKEKKENIQKKESTPQILNKNKTSYGELDNVLLTEVEYDKLKERFGVVGARSRIGELSLALGSKGYKYKSHYATILTWDRRDKKEHPELNPRW